MFILLRVVFEMGVSSGILMHFIPIEKYPRMEPSWMARYVRDMDFFSIMIALLWR